MDLCAGAPVVEFIEPMALRPGEETILTLHGKNLAGATTLWTGFPATIRPGATNGGDKQTVFRVVVSGAVPRGIGAFRVVTPEGVSPLQLIAIDDLPRVADDDDNCSRDKALTLKPPVAVDGQAAALAEKHYRVSGQAGVVLHVDVVAQRIASPLDPLLRLLDDRGRELAWCEDAIGADPQLAYLFKADASVWLAVRDSAFRGERQHRFHLRASFAPLAELAVLPLQNLPSALLNETAAAFVEEIEPNESRETASKLPLPAQVRGAFAQPGDRDWFQFSLEKNERIVITGRTRSLGSPCDLSLRLCQPDGSTLAEADPTGANEGTLTNLFKEAGTCLLVVQELTGRGGPDLRYELDLRREADGFDLSVETDTLQGAPGKSVPLKVTATRRGYKGPIELKLVGTPDDYSLTNNVIAAKTNETTLKLTLPDDAKVGTLLHFGIEGHATDGDQKLVTRASTLLALRKAFPELLFPPRLLDGPIALAIVLQERPVKTGEGKARED
jgi:hypothetical protein